MKKLLKILLLILITFHLATSAKAQCDCNPTRDSLALVIFKDSLNITFWDTKKPINTWEGVSISAEGCVESLVLPNRKLRGILPKVIFDNLYCLKVLDLSSKSGNNESNFLTISIPASISNFSSLEKLNLSQNPVIAIAPEFESLVNLKILNLDNCSISVFPTSITMLSRLEELRFSNPISYLPEEISNLVQLRILDLNNHNLQSIPTSIEKLTNLEQLILAYTDSLFTIPKEIGKLSELQLLNLSSCKLKILPKEIGDLKKLRWLYLGGNALSELPAEIGGLSRLETIELWGNPFRELPAEIGNLTQLKTLILFLSRLKQLPISMKNLSNLTYLDLSYNSLDTFPVPTDNLKQLQTLIISFNKLNNFPAQITLITSLRTLELDSNKINTIPSNLNQLTRLKTLTLSLNAFNSFPSPITQLDSLENLTLSSNKIGNVPNTINRLTRLKKLDLSSNALDSFPSPVTQLFNLKELYLNKNKIKGAVPQSINQLTLVNRLDIENNQLSGFPLLTINKDTLRELKIAQNRLTFDDILPNLKYLPVVSYYNPQKSFPTNTPQIFPPCDSSIISLNVDDTVSTNFYRWFKSSIQVNFDQSNKLHLKELKLNGIPLRYNDYVGFYSCEITNQNIPNMALKSDPIEVKVSNPCIATTKTRNDTLCFYDSIVINTTTYNRANPSGCEVLRGQSCDTLVNINLTFQRTDTTITDTLAWGERRWIHNRWYDCSTPTDTIWLDSRNMKCDSAIYVQLHCKTVPEDGGRKLEFTIPTAFTPNADGNNDTFDIPNIINDPNKYGSNHLQVFNRFRQLVYERVNYQNQWDGHDLQGKALPAGTYFYVFQYEGNDPKTGTVTIIR